MVLYRGVWRCIGVYGVVQGYMVLYRCVCVVMYRCGYIVIYSAIIIGMFRYIIIIIYEVPTHLARFPLTVRERNAGSFPEQQLVTDLAFAFQRSSSARIAYENCRGFIRQKKQAQSPALVVLMHPRYSSTEAGLKGLAIVKSQPAEICGLVSEWSIFRIA